MTMAMKLKVIICSIRIVRGVVRDWTVNIMIKTFLAMLLMIPALIIAIPLAILARIFMWVVNSLDGKDGDQHES